MSKISGSSGVIGVEMPMKGAFKCPSKICGSTFSKQEWKMSSQAAVVHTAARTFQCRTRCSTGVFTVGQSEVYGERRGSSCVSKNANVAKC